MIDEVLQRAIANVPAGAWAVGVSGGADSVALLHLLHEQRASDISLHVVHLDHQTRAGESAKDAEFVERLARRLRLRGSFANRSDVERNLASVESNPSARYRAARMKFFGDVVAKEQLRGVILAHHADDQAETILLRLLRGAGPAGLGGMSREATVCGLLILRPLLDVPASSLRACLQSGGAEWRQDTSNAATNQLRNRVRPWLRANPKASAALRELGRACEAWTRWLRENAPRLGERFSVRQLDEVAPPLGRESLRRWLRQGAGDESIEIAPAAVERLLEMIRDAATPARQDFPGGVRVRRRGGIISAENPGPES